VASAIAVAWYRLRATLRNRLTAYLALAISIGLVGGVAIAAMTAARRTDSSYPDYLASTNPAALILQPNSQNNAPVSVDQAYRSYLTFLAQLRDLPHVRGLASADAIAAGTLTPAGRLGAVLFTQVQLVGSHDGMFSRVNKVTIVQGKAADPRSLTQVVATTKAASLLHLHVGSRLPVGIFSASNPGSIAFYRKLDLTVTGIGVVSTQIVQDDIDADRTGFLIGTPALDRAFVPCCTATSYIGLQLPDGSRFDSAVGQEYQQLTNTSPYFAHGGANLLQLMEIYVTAEIESQAQRAIRPEAIALGVFAIIAGLAALAIGAQAISRQLRASGPDNAVLRALGASPAVATADSVGGILATVATGAGLAALVAIGLSPLSLFGPVRAVQPGSGVYVDWTVLGLGVLSLLLILGAITLVTGYRQAPHRVALRPAPTAGTSAVVRASLGAGLPVAAITGLRFALETGRGRSAVPVRSVIAGAMLTVLVGSAALTFGASLTRLVSQPALYGWNFCCALYSTDGWGPFPPQLTDPLLKQDKLIGATTGVSFLTVQIDHQTVPAILSPVRAAVAPLALSGHALTGPGQIVLGPATLAALHKHVGDYVTVQLGPVIRGARLRIAGTAALPAIGDTLGIHPSLSTGAVLPVSVVAPAALQEEEQYSGPNAIFVRLRPGVSETAGMRSLQRIADAYNAFAHSPRIVSHGGVSALELDASVLRVQRPAEIVNYRSMGSTPAILAAGLAAGAVAALGVTLVASVHRRRRDFALLKTLGCTRGQLAGAVAWQSTVIVASGLIAGIPLGIAAGRWLWLAFARELSAVPEPVIPAGSLVLACAAALILANLIAAFPGRSASRVPAATVLRSE
jgi:hypothetical protein